MFGQYNFLNMLKVYKQNQGLINAQLQGKTVEGYDGDGDIDNTKWLKLGASRFMVMVLISGAIWIWALVITLKYWNNISDIARLFAVLTLLTGVGGPIVTIIIIYMSKGPERIGSGYNFRFR